MKPMKLKKLIANLPLKVAGKGKEVEITGLCSHSKFVAPGNLFVAKQGCSDDGTKYIEEAVDTGAVAILTDMANPFLKEIPQLVHPDVRAMEAQLASRFYGYPSKELYTVGVTGTNGKTTVASLTKHMFDHLGMRCGLVGTIEYIIGSHHFEAERTTPDVITNQKLLREMLKQGCQSAVLEVSSHGIAQGRVDEIAFDAAIFTNLSQDHLDYHGTMEAYAAEKAKLFSNLPPDKVAILNYECPWIPKIREKCRAKILMYGFSSGADVCADVIDLSPSQTRFNVTFRGETVTFCWGLIGRHNILNALAVLSLCLSKGFSLDQLVPLLASFPSVSGRLEKVENLGGYHIYVDYGHTPDALEKVLTCLQEIKRGKLIVIFGCGGDRDRGKRAQMGAVADRLADYTLITTDNPRTEDPMKICHEIASGMTSSHSTIEVDRRSAIEKALEMASSEDLILIAGKGHETYQIFMHQRIPFDDRQVAQEVANRIFS